jgi:hypothetical protein
VSLIARLIRVGDLEFVAPRVVERHHDGFALLDDFAVGDNHTELRANLQPDGDGKQADDDRDDQMVAGREDGRRAHGCLTSDAPFARATKIIVLPAEFAMCPYVPVHCASLRGSVSRCQMRSAGARRTSVVQTSTGA